jgi:biopolymer transport protein ExbD
VIVELGLEKIQVSAMSDTLTEDILEKWERVLIKKDAKNYPLDELSSYLMDLKQSYPASDTILLIPDENVKYDSIIHTMDIARKSNEQTLFPNVVLSGSLG